MDPHQSSWNPEGEPGTQVPRRNTAPAAEACRAESVSDGERGERIGRRTGYGLPCANCKTYYAADLAACPYCGCPERLMASSAPVPATELKQELDNLRAEIAQALGEQSLPGGPEAPVRSAEEREQFLRQYKSQLYASHTQINPATAFRCSLERNHGQSYEPAAVCKKCYNQAAERMEQLEAILCMDVREAAQLIYEAVWSDPTPNDPSRTYQNAAQAILGELRRRAGLSMMFGAAPPYTH
jgi:hypothetical protein